MKNILSVAAGTVSSHKVVSPEIDVTNFSALADVAFAAVVTGGTATAPVSAELQTCATSGGTFSKVADLTVGSDYRFDTRDCSKYVRVQWTLDNATTGATVSIAVAGNVEER